MTVPKFLLPFLFTLLIAVQAYSQYNYKAYLEEAEKDVDNKNYSEAIQKLNVCIQVKPAEGEAYFYRGVCKYFLNDFQGSLQDLDNAVSHFSMVFYEAFHFRARCKERLEDYEGAIADFNKIIDKYNKDPDIFVERAFSKLYAQDYNGAIADCNKAATLQPIGIQVAGEDIFLCRGDAETMLNEFDKALKDLDKAISINPKNENAYAERGITKHKMGDYKDALEDFDRALKIDSGCTFAYYNRAQTKIQLNDKKGALQDYNSVLKYEPSNAAAYFSRAALEADMTQYKAAIADFNKVLELNPENIEATFELAKLKEQVRDFKGAIADYTKCIDLFPYFIEAYYDRSQLKKSLGDFEGAKKDYDTGKMMSELNRSKSSSQLARDSIALSHLKDLTADFDNVSTIVADTVNIDLLPIYYIVYKDSSIKNTEHYLPLLLKESKKLYSNFYLTNKEAPLPAEARNGFSADSAALLPSVRSGAGLEALLQVALQKTKMQLFNDAIKDYDKLVMLYPASALVYFARAVNACREVELLSQFDEAPAFLNQKNKSAVNQKNEIFQKALSDLNKAVQLEPSFAVAFYDRAFVKCRLQDFNGAIKDYDNAIHANTDLSDAYYNRGLFLLHLRDKNDACKDFSKAGELGLAESYAVIKKYCPR